MIVYCSNAMLNKKVKLLLEVRLVMTERFFVKWNSMEYLYRIIVIVIDMLSSIQ